MWDISQYTRCDTKYIEFSYIVNEKNVGIAFAFDGIGMKTSERQFKDSIETLKII